MLHPVIRDLAATAVETKKWEPMEFNDARKASIKTAFEAEATDGKLTMKSVHKLVFTEEERGEYGFDTFEEVRLLHLSFSEIAAARSVMRAVCRFRDACCLPLS